MAKVTTTAWQALKPRPDVYPLIMAVGAGVSFAIYKGCEHMTNPDVQLDRTRRSTEAWNKYDATEGEAWRTRVMKHYRQKEDPLRDLSIFEVLTPRWWQHRAEVHADPKANTNAGTTTLQ